MISAQERAARRRKKIDGRTDGQTGSPRFCDIPISPAPEHPTPPPILLNLTLEILPRHQFRDIVIIVIPSSALAVLPAAAAGAGAPFLLLQGLVALGEFAEGGEAVGPELVEDSRDEFGEFFVFAVAVDGEGVGGDRGVDFDFLELVGGCIFGGREEGRRMWERREGRRWKGRRWKGREGCFL